jgi:hypothetical protein
MQEKSFKEIEQEYERRKLESKAMGDRHGHWQKCPRCGGTTLSTCEACKGLGHVPSQKGTLQNPSGKSTCTVCGGRGQAGCRQAGCQGGWVWVTEKTA